ncbi:hypothetical protein QE152_g19097 [Popillia japonica]|uniref:Uncharacterized protein n=1 Tax=Popillia japonica TaxID=7064 RepID=A0AAW1L0Z0_POPJA
MSRQEISASEEITFVADSGANDNLFKDDRNSAQKFHTAKMKAGAARKSSPVEAESIGIFGAELKSSLA